MIHEKRLSQLYMQNFYYICRTSYVFMLTSDILIWLYATTSGAAWCHFLHSKHYGYHCLIIKLNSIKWSSHPIRIMRRTEQRNTKHDSMRKLYFTPSPAFIFISLKYDWVISKWRYINNAICGVNRKRKNITDLHQISYKDPIDTT